MKILVIDDEKPTLSMFRLFLTAYGYDVYVAEDGEKGLALFNEVAPGIVFTDIKMPGIDGLEVLRRIKKTGSTAQVIIITGHGDMESAVEALDLNASDFINKPVERQALNSALSRAEKRRSMPENQPFEFVRTKSKDGFGVFIKGKLTELSKQVFLSFFNNESLDEVKEVNLIFDDSFSIDRSGISTLMDVIQDLKQKDISIIMENLSYNYIKVFQMAGMHKIAMLKETLPDE